MVNGFRKCECGRCYVVPGGSTGQDHYTPNPYHHSNVGRVSYITAPEEMELFHPEEPIPKNGWEPKKFFSECAGETPAGR